MALAISICKKDTKIIFSRQFIKMTKNNLQEHITNFCRKLIENRQNKIIEFKNYFYTYIPLEIDELYLVLTTTNSANVFNNIKILETVYKGFSNICKSEGMNENSLKAHSIELVFVVDEIITQNGLLDEENIENVKQNLKMCSYEEKHYLKDKEQKDKQIKENFDKKMLEYEEEKKKGTYKSADSVSAEKLELQKQEEKEREIIRKYRSLQLDLERKERRFQLARNHIIESYFTTDPRVDTFLITCQALLTKMVEMEMTKEINNIDSDEEEQMPRNTIIINPLTFLNEFNSDEEDIND